MTASPTVSRGTKIGVAVVLVATLLAGFAVLLRSGGSMNRNNVVAYFDNSNMIFVGDDVRILGVPVGKIDKIEPEYNRVKVSFWYDSDHKVPADAKAAILSPALVTGRSLALTPVYSGGPVMGNNAVINQDRTAVPVEWASFREQLERLTETLQPTEPGGVSTLGALVNTTADNLRGQGADIRKTVISLSGVLRTRRSQHRHLQHREEPVHSGVGAAGQHRPDAPAEPESGQRHRVARRRSQRSRLGGQRSQRRSGGCPVLRCREPGSPRYHVGQAGRGHPDAQRQSR